MATAKWRASRPLLQALWVVAAAAAVLIAVLAEPKAQLRPGEDALVLAADAKLADALRAGDRSTARHLLSLQFSYADASGRVYGRKEFLAALKKMAAAPAADSKATVYGGVAMVTGHRKSAQDTDTFFLDIWAKQKGAWRALTMQDVVLAEPKEEEEEEAITEDSAALEKTLQDFAKSYECNNPCQTIPYRVRSSAEQDIVNAYQALDKATIARDADGYQKYLASEFIHYEPGIPPVSRSARIARLDDMKSNNVPGFLPAVQSMRLWVYGDGAAMISTDVIPDDTEPVQRVARVWVKRNGQWQMAISVQTDIDNPSER